ELLDDRRSPHDRARAKGVARYARPLPPSDAREVDGPPAWTRSGSAPMAEPRQREGPHAARSRHAQRDDLDRRFGQPIRVEPAMALVEASDHRVDRKIALRPRHRDLEALVAIAQISVAGQAARSGGDALGREPRLRLPLELAIDGDDCAAIVVRWLL